MENEFQLQKVTNPNTLEQVGFKTLSAKLTTSLIQKDRMELNILKREIVENGKPKFEMIFNGGKTTTVQEMKKSIGEKNVVKLLVLLLEDLVNYFNVQRPMTIDQITDLAFEISSELQGDRFEEIIAFFEGIKRQQYGKIYERFDAPTFWKFYWGEDADDPNSYNFKKMDWFHLDATRNFTKEPIVKSELEQELAKARTSGNVVKDFTAMVKAKFPKPDEK
jgi:hypothetical protein